MEPISIITGAIAFASSCVYTLRDLNDAISKVEELPQTLSTLERKIALLSKVLLRLEGMMRDEQDPLGFLQDEVVVMVLQGCQDTLERLHFQLKRLVPLGGHWHGNKLGRLSKGMMAFWKEGDIAQMVLSVEREQSSLQFIMISHMSLDSPSEGSFYDTPTRSYPQRRNTEFLLPRSTHQTDTPIQIFEDGDQPMGGALNCDPPPEYSLLQGANQNTQRPRVWGASGEPKTKEEKDFGAMKLSGEHPFL